MDEPRNNDDGHNQSNDGPKDNSHAPQHTSSTAKWLLTLGGWRHLGTVLALFGLVWFVARIENGFRRKDPSVTAGECRVFYNDGVSRGEAQRLADSNSKGLMGGVFGIARVDDLYQWTWYVKDSTAADDQLRNGVARDGWRISAQVFDFAPLRVRVVTESGKELCVENCHIPRSKKFCQGNECILYSEAVTTADVQRLADRFFKVRQVDTDWDFRKVPLYLDHRNGEYTLQLICYYAKFEPEVGEQNQKAIEIMAWILSEDCFSGAPLSFQLCDAQLRPHRIIAKPKTRPED